MPTDAYIWKRSSVPAAGQSLNPLPTIVTSCINDFLKAKADTSGGFDSWNAGAITNVIFYKYSNYYGFAIILGYTIARPIYFKWVSSTIAYNVDTCYYL